MYRTQNQMETNKKIKKIEKIASKSQKVATSPPAAPSEKAGEKVKHVFENLKKHFEPAKVDEFQEKWLALPENRTKYKKITDAPKVAVEEVIAMTNDLIQYIQGQKGGNSGLLQKIHTGLSTFFKNPAKFVQDKAEAGKEMVVEMKDKVEDKAADLKATTKEKTKATVKKTVEKTKAAVVNPAKTSKRLAKKVSNSPITKAKKTAIKPTPKT